MKRKPISIFLILILIFSLSACLNVQAEEISILPATSNLFSGQLIHWDIEYSDSYFDGDPSVYNHKLAQASVGLAISSYRNNSEKDRSTDAWIKEYISAAGFTNIHSEGYDQETNEHTVSSIIASKRLEGFTLIVAVPCGGGYGNEWLSNFTVGSGERHQGFNEAAQLVEERIINYIKDNNITGDIKLWMSGYSRGAATANLVEADMTNSGLFAAVYGYNFAVPRNTKEKGNYTNIFNILGKFDPVTMIPLAEWGYERYGIDLYTPAQENDSYYFESKEEANDINQKLTESDFYNSPETNSQLHMMLEYLLQLLPEDTIYEDSLQDSIKEAWTHRDLDSLFEIASNAIKNMNTHSAEQSATAASLLSYIESVVLIHLQGNVRQIREGYWDSNDSIASNIIREHNPHTYVDWMFSSDDPEEIFDNCPITNRLIISGQVVAEIYDENGFIESIDLNDNISYTPPEGETSSAVSIASHIYALRQGTQTIITIPGDKEYTIKLNVLKSKTIGILNTRYDVAKTKGTPSKFGTISSSTDDDKIIIVKITPDSEEPEILKEDGSEADVWYSDLPYSPTTLIQLESVNVFHLSISSLIIIIIIVMSFIALVLLVSIAIAIIHALSCRKRGKPFSKYYVIIPHLILILLFFLIAEVSGYILPAIKILPPIMATLATVIMFLLSIRGNIRHNCKRNTIIMLILFILSIAMYFIMYYTRIGVVSLFQFLLLTLYYVIGSTAAIFTFPHEGKLKTIEDRNN